MQPLPLIQPEPIATAPRDGQPILSDSGIIQWLDRESCITHWGHADDGKWVHCYPGGTIVEDSDYGIQTASPTLWAPLPEWMA